MPANGTRGIGTGRIVLESRSTAHAEQEAFLKGIAAHTQYETNIKINGVLRNLLFGDPASPVRFGVNLASLNIQRGRDHGLPDYNSVRKFYTGASASGFTDINRNDTLARNLRSLYKYQ